MDRLFVRDFEWYYNEKRIKIKEKEKKFKLVRGAVPRPKEDDLWVHCASTICVESRYRIKWAKQDPPKKVPKLSMQDVIDAVRAGDVHDVLNWMTFIGPTTESICPFKGEQQNFHLYSQDWDRFPIKRYLHLRPQINPSANAQLLLQLKSDGPFLAAYTISVDYTRIDHKTQIYMGLQDQDPRNHLKVDSESETFLPADTYLVTVIGEGCKNNISYWVYLNNLGPKWGRHGKGMVAKSAVEDAYIPILA